MRRLLASLTGKLVLALTLLIVALCFFYLILTLVSTKAHLQAVDQSLNADVARRILERGLNTAIFDVEADLSGTIFTSLMEINPNAEIYLLDAEGGLVSHAAPAGKVKLASVSLEPVLAFVRKSRSYPIYGDDPRNPAERKVFSAAEVVRSGKTAGYVYVVLGGEAYDSAASMFRESYILRLSTGLIGGSALMAMILGALSFRRLTKPLSELARAIRAFDAQNPQPLAAGIAFGERADDEIGQLARSFDHMGRRISQQIKMLKDAEAMRRQFMTYISHDLKMPISTIQGYLETLLMKWEETPAEQRERYLSAALKANDRIYAMVEGIFELSKLEGPEAPLRVETFSMAELIQDICQKLQIEAEKANVELTADWRDPSIYLTGDIGLIERALVNVIENAIKFSDPGEAVRVEITALDGRVYIDVTNKGPAIDDDERQKIFMPFYRGRSAGREKKGNGLGLAVAKRIAELHGGEIELSSAADNGTRFTLVF